MDKNHPLEGDKGEEALLETVGLENEPANDWAARQSHYQWDDQEEEVNDASTSFRVGMLRTPKREYDETWRIAVTHYITETDHGEHHDDNTCRITGVKTGGENHLWDH